MKSPPRRSCTSGQPITVRAKRFVVACGAVNTAALLLRSASATHPRGLANSSDQVGRNYMAHVTTFFLAIDPRRKNEAVYQKTIGINDWYTAGPSNKYPLGNVQGLGKLEGRRPRWASPGCRCPSSTKSPSTPWTCLFRPRTCRSRRTGWHLNSSGQITLTRRETNLAAHHELIKRMKKVVRKAGFPVVLTRSLGVEATSHQCGTARMGEDPATSVVDRRSSRPRSGQPLDRRQFAVPVLGRGQSRDHRRGPGAAAGPSGALTA